MAKTTVKPGNPYKGESGRMPSTTGNPSGKSRGNNPPASHSSGNKGGKKMKKIATCMSLILVALTLIINLLGCKWERI